MTCPICSRTEIPKDVGRIDTQGTRVYLNGKINDIGFSKRPFRNYFTVTLQTDDGAKYLKFKTQEEMDKWNFKEGMEVQCEGCLHKSSEKDVVLDITSVKLL